jgi:hypothetical protein
MRLVDQVMIQIYLINVLIQAQINVNNFHFQFILIRFFDLDCTYPGSRFKDEVTEYYYGGDENRHTPVSKPSFQNHLETLDDRYGPPRPKGNIINNPILFFPCLQ